MVSFGFIIKCFLKILSFCFKKIIKKEAGMTKESI